MKAESCIGPEKLRRAKPKSEKVVIVLPPPVAIARLGATPSCSSLLPTAKAAAPAKATVAVVLPPLVPGLMTAETVEPPVTSVVGSAAKATALKLKARMLMTRIRIKFPSRVDDCVRGDDKVKCLR
jgi:hypothetical protein